MKTTTMRITGLFVAIILAIVGAFLAGSMSSTEVEIRTKTVTKVDPIEHCLVASLKQYGTETVIPECASLTDAQQTEALDVIDIFLDAMFSEEALETYEG